MPTSAYGGPKVDEETLTVTARRSRPTARRSRSKIDGLKPDRVVHVRSPRPFDAQDGESLWSTEAWYTLNTLPGYVAPVSDGLYELEDGLLTGGAQFDTEHAGYSGTGFVSGFGTVGASVKVDVDAAKAGDYRMALRYANGPNPFDGPKTISLIVNGTSRQITLPPTGAWPSYQLYVDDVALDAGANTIELKHAAGDDGHVNLDSLRLAPAGTTRYEAEAATLGRRRERPDRAPRLQRRGLRRRLPEPGREHDVQGHRARGRPGGGHARVRQRPEPVRGHQGSEPVRQQRVREEARAAGHRRVGHLRTIDETLVLRAGSNDVSIRYDAGDDGNVNLDYLDVEQNEPPQCEPGIEPERRVRRRRARPLPLDDDPQRGPVRLLARRRQAADRGAGGRHRRRHHLRAERRAPARADRRQLGGDHEGVDRRRRRLIQAGLVAHASAGSRGGKVVVMRRPRASG